jgi:hypothetical protein
MTPLEEMTDEEFERYISSARFAPAPATHSPWRIRFRPWRIGCAGGGDAVDV